MNPFPPTSEETSHDAWVRTAMAAHQPALLRYATRLLGDPERARDVVQDTFVRLVAQSPAALNDHVAEWLYTVCRHRALDVLRKEGRMSPLTGAHTERLSAHEPLPGRQLEAAETHAALLRLVDRLPPNQQEVVRLKFQGGFSYKEISRITALSLGNVGFLLHTALHRLRREWLAETAKL